MLLIVLHASSVLAQMAGNLVPFSQAPLQDKAGNEWFIEQNGNLQRSGSAPSIISGCMVMQFGNQQFYTQQPMMTPDGREIVMPSGQPLNGLSITRRVTLLDREGGLRYLEEFTNTTNRDLAVNIEFRHGFNGQTRGFLSDTGRPLKDAFEAGESGIVVQPGANEPNAAAVVFTVCAPGTPTPPRLSARNNYQLSVVHSLTLPAGQTRYLIHSIGQVKLPADAKPEDIARAFRPFAMSNLTKGLSKNVLKLAANLQGQRSAFGVEAWFPTEHWGIAAEASDVLTLDHLSRLKGSATWTSMTWRHRLGEREVRIDEVAAIAGPRFTRNGNSRLWLRDGQVWNGQGSAEGMRFTLTNGIEMELSLDHLDRLVLAASADATPALTHTLVETWPGERFALTADGAWQAETPWGSLTVPWADTVALAAPRDGDMAARLFLADGTRLQVLPLPTAVPVQTRSFGTQNFNFADLRQAITPRALGADADDDGDAAESFIEVVGDQRLLGRITGASIRMLTRGAPLDLTAACIRELRDVTADHTGMASTSGSPVFQADLWGGGTVVGSLAESSLRVEGRGFTWTIPVRLITRFVNPIPVADSALMRRIGLLLQELGDPQWQVREKATTQLREMGALAKTSLQEALKISTDAEVTRRIEELLAAME